MKKCAHSKNVQINPPGMMADETSLLRIVSPPVKSLQSSATIESGMQMPSKSTAVHRVISDAARAWGAARATGTVWMAKMALRAVNTKVAENILLA